MGTRSLCRKEAECLGNNQNNHLSLIDFSNGNH